MQSWQQAFGHGARIFGLAFQPHTADVIASASEDETIRVWSRDSSTGAWQQTSCCRGHTSEVLRVAWSPDGRLLASGSADHTVRFWSVSTSPTAHSYTGTELAVLSGHPEEVYAVHFLPEVPQDAQQQQRVQNATDQLVSSTLDGPAAAPAANGSVSSGASSSSSSLLLTASGDSLYLWDLAAGQLLQQSAPLPVLRTLPAFAAAVAGPGGSSPPQVQQQQQQQETKQQQAPNASISDPRAESLPDTSGLTGNSSGQTGDQDSSEQGTESSEDGFEEPTPSYIFGVSVCPVTNWAAATCSDGMLRLWDASRRALTEVAAVQVHAGQLGSTVSWLPHQPLCVSSISKHGQLVLQDVRLLGRPLLQQQLEGPVYDAVWVAVNTSAVAAAGSGSGAGGVAELQLVVAGRDSHLRAYTLTPEALQQGHLATPQLLSAPGSYSGSLLALAATPDGRWLAAAGEAVEAGTLQPTQEQQQQHHASQQQQDKARSAARRGSAAARRGRSKAAARLDLLNMADDERSQEAAVDALMFSNSTLNPAATAVPGGHTGAANCAAAAAGVLTRAPVFVCQV